MVEVPEHAYRGARAMVVLHEQHLRAFLDAWNQAKASGVPLPQVADPDYMLPAKHCCATCWAPRGAT